MKRITLFSVIFLLLLAGGFLVVTLADRRDAHEPASQSQVRGLGQGQGQGSSSISNPAPSPGSAQGQGSRPTSTPATLHTKPTPAAAPISKTPDKK